MARRRRPKARGTRSRDKPPQDIGEVKQGGDESRGEEPPLPPPQEEVGSPRDDGAGGGPPEEEGESPAVRSGDEEAGSPAEGARRGAVRRLRDSVAAPPPPPDEAGVVLSVLCGENKGTLDLRRLDTGSRGPCVRFQAAWLTPNEYQYVSGRETAKDWKRSIKHFGKSLKILAARGLLSLGDRRCRCEKCGGEAEGDPDSETPSPIGTTTPPSPCPTPPQPTLPESDSLQLPEMTLGDVTVMDAKAEIEPSSADPTLVDPEVLPSPGDISELKPVTNSDSAEGGDLESVTPTGAMEIDRSGEKSGTAKHDSDEYANNETTANGEVVEPPRAPSVPMLSVMPGGEPTGMAAPLETGDSGSTDTTTGPAGSIVIDREGGTKTSGPVSRGQDAADGATIREAEAPNAGRRGTKRPSTTSRKATKRQKVVSDIRGANDVKQCADDTEADSCMSSTPRAIFTAGAADTQRISQERCGNFILDGGGGGGGGGGDSTPRTADDFKVAADDSTVKDGGGGEGGDGGLGAPTYTSAPAGGGVDPDVHHHQGGEDASLAEAEMEKTEAISNVVSSQSIDGATTRKSKPKSLLSIIDSLASSRQEPGYPVTPRSHSNPEQVVVTGTATKMADVSGTHTEAGTHATTAAYPRGHRDKGHGDKHRHRNRQSPKGEAYRRKGSRVSQNHGEHVRSSPYRSPRSATQGHTSTPHRLVQAVPPQRQLPPPRNPHEATRDKEPDIKNQTGNTVTPSAQALAGWMPLCLPVQYFQGGALPRVTPGFPATLINMPMSTPPLGPTPPPSRHAAPPPPPPSRHSIGSPSIPRPHFPPPQPAHTSPRAAHAPSNVRLGALPHSAVNGFYGNHLPPPQEEPLALTKPRERFVVDPSGALNLSKR